MKKIPYIDILKSLLPSNEWEAFLKSYNKPLPKNITVITHKISTKEFIREVDHQGRQLTASRVTPHASPHESNSFQISKSEHSIQYGHHFLHQGGFFYIQEQAASLPAKVLLDDTLTPLRKGEAELEAKQGDLLPRSEIILDMCAAPGGKSIQLADSLLLSSFAKEEVCRTGGFEAPLEGGCGGFIVSNEPIDPRRKALIFNINRTGCYNTMVTSYDGTRIGILFPETFDKVLIDAPCSGEGMNYKLDRKRKLRSKNSFDGRAMPTIGETASSNEVKELQISKTIVHKIAIQQSRDELKIKKIASLQYQLLKSGILACKAGGTIIYSTCTLNPIENEGVIANIMQEFSGKIELGNVDVEGKSTGIDNRRGERIMESNQASKLARFRPHRNNIGGFFIAKIKKLETLSSSLSPFYKGRSPQDRGILGGGKGNETKDLKHGFITSPALQSEVRHHLQDEFGIEKNDKYFFLGTANNIYVTSPTYRNLPDHLKNNAGKIGIPIYSIGDHIKKQKHLRSTNPDPETRDWIPTHHLGNILGHLATRNVIELTDQQAQDYSDHKDILLCPPFAKEGNHAVVEDFLQKTGQFIILTRQKKGFSIGKIVNGKIKNKMI